MKDIVKAIIEGVVSQGKIVGSRGHAFRASSSSDATGKHDHGIDIGASRNYAHEKAAKERSEFRAREREREVEKRNKEAEQRKKEVSKMASEEHIEEAKGKFVYDKPLKVHVAAMEKRDTADLKSMHDRWAGDHKDKKSNPEQSERLLAAHHILRKRGVAVPELPQHRNLGMMKYTTEEADSSGTKARTKIKNVARLEDSAPTSEKSTLGKTGQIKTKIIDEGKPTMSLPNFGLPASLIAAARQIVEKKNDDDNGEAKKMEGGKTAVIIDPETDDKIDESEPKKKHTTPKTPKDKKLAALAHPKDKITHKDVLVGRGVVKEEEVEEAIKPYVSYSAGGVGKTPSATVMGANEKPHKTFTKAEHGADYKQKAMEYFKKHGQKLKEEEQLDEVNHREFGAKGKMHPDMAKGMKVGQHADFYARGSGDKTYGKVTKNDGKSVHLDVKGKAHRFSVTSHLGEEVEEIEEKTLYGTPDEHKRKLDLIAKKEKALPPGISPARKALAIQKQKLKKTHSASMGMKEDVSLSDEEKARIEELAKSFPAEIDEAAKKSVPSATTAVSSPIRGANQDQSGVGTKSSTADYTISDSKKMKVKEEVELEEGRGRPRKNPLPPGKEAEGDDTHKHPMQQLEKISHSIEGNEPHFEHKDGSKSKITKHLAKHIVAIHNSMRTTQEKDNFAQKVHANRDSLRSEVSKHF